MRISGGQARGIPLRVPPGDAVRPATDGMRQAVFSSIASRVPGARFFDLCAGSGAYGLEALSRGAAGGVFVEKNAKAVACVRTNLAAVCKSLGRDEREMAANLFRALRQADRIGAKVIFAEGVEPVGVGLAVMNRLLRAAAFRVVET